MILKTYTLIHVLISLVAILAGLVVAWGMLGARRMDGWTRLFLATTVLTTVTGFFFPFRGFTPALGTGLMSMCVLAVAMYARYARGLAGGWRRTYAVSALAAFYLNAFVLIVQSFQKIPALNQIAPTQKEPPFVIAQLIALAAFIALGFLAATRFRPESTASVPEAEL